MKRGLEAYTPTQVGALRMFISFLFLLPFALPNIKYITKQNWKYFLLVGLLGNTLPAYLFTSAQTGISSSLSGILNALTPLFTMLIGLLFFKSQINKFNILGITIGLLGASLLIISGRGIGSNANFFYGSFVVLATLFYGISVNVIRYKLSNVSSLAITSLAFLMIGPLNGLLLFNTDFLTQYNTHPKANQSLLFISLLSIGGTAIAVLLYNLLIKKTNAIFASSVTYFIPIVAVIWGVLDGEVFKSEQAVCIGIILAGVWLVNKK